MPERYARTELQELDSLIGLASVKEQVGRFVRRLANERYYRAQGLSILPARRHLVFSGPVGVGKRKVARIFGRICKQLGTLDKGHMVVVDNADLTIVGRSDRLTRMRGKCEAALDGILYVRNEAFLSAGILRSTGDLHEEAVDVMIEFMTKHHSRIVVILDARPNQLHYISFHSSLARRFTEMVEFPPYDALELLQILATKARESSLELPQGVEAHVLPWVVSASRRNDWANAHAIADLFGKALAARALRLRSERCANFGGLTLDDFNRALLAIEMNDLPDALPPAAVSSGLPAPRKGDSLANPCTALRESDP